MSSTNLDHPWIIHICSHWHISKSLAESDESCINTDMGFETGSPLHVVLHLMSVMPHAVG